MMAAAITALTGTRCSFSLAKCFAPGMAPSRLKAKNIRLVLVMQATVQKNWPAARDDDDEAGHVRGQRLAEDGEHAAAALGDAVLVLDREQERQQQDPAADAGVEDRPPDALGRSAGGGLGLLGEVGRRVVPGDRVLGQDAGQREEVEEEPEPAGMPAEQAGVVDRAAEHVTDRGVVGALGQEEPQDDDDDRRTDDVPPDRDVVEHGQQVAGEDVHDGGQGQDDRELDEDPGQRVVAGPGVAEVADAGVEEGRAAVGHRRDDRDQADQVEPAGVEAGASGRRASRPTSRCRRMSGRPRPARTCTSR